MATRSSPGASSRLRHIAAAGMLVAAVTARAQDAGRASADVVVIVDTSTSMRQTGMDPERASLLVTKLLADIVPGDLAVVRLLDVDDDRDVIPSRATGQSIPCQEDPSTTCGSVEPTIDWQAAAREQRLGSLERPARADAAYKGELETHLEQRSNNSMFYLAFRAAEGIFDRHRNDATRAREVTRTVIWLSDGRSEGPDVVRESIGNLTGAGVAVEAFIFGRGDTALANAAGLHPSRVSTPAEIMKAFAGAFRRIVQAPYEIDEVVGVQPSFEMKRSVEEAWIVVYGDESLGEVTLTGPSQAVRADYAADLWRGAGAYKVAYIEKPAAGKWTVHASGGGVGVAYAVVQRSSLAPALLEPRKVFSGARARLVVGVHAGSQRMLVTDPELLRDLTVTAEFQGQTVTLLDRGTAPDAAANDGHFSAPGVFRGTGRVPVRLHIRSPLVDRSVDTFVEVSGSFRYAGPPVEVDLGTLRAGTEVCRPLVFASEFLGEIPFELREMRHQPRAHQLSLRIPKGKLLPGRGSLNVVRDQRMSICLSTTKSASSSVANGEPWLELHVAGSEKREHVVPIRLRWQVHELTFWERWGTLILILLAVLVLLFLIGGYLIPQRFQGGLAVVFVPDHDELDEQLPQPIRQWRGVGIGFYRNARAFLHPDFRLSGRPHGALASLHAEKGGARVVPRGLPLYRATLGADWESVPPDGRRARGGDVYRLGDRGPYFRIATRGLA